MFMIKNWNSEAWFWYEQWINQLPNITYLKKHTLILYFISFSKVNPNNYTNFEVVQKYVPWFSDLTDAKIFMFNK